MSRFGHHAEETPEQVLHIETQTTPGQIVRLEGSEGDHARRSLRLRPGDPVWLVDGQGRRYAGHVTDLEKHSIDVRVEQTEDIPIWPQRRIHLGVGILRSTRMDFIVEKASELGVARLVPLRLKHCMAKPEAEGTRQERWRRLAVESLKQSHRSMLLELTPPQDLGEFLAGLPAGRALWVADPQGEDPRAGAQGLDPPVLALVVGPEGGLAPEELAALERAGGRRIALGGHRLRAETASLTLVTAALAAFGDLGSGSRSR